MRWYIWYHIWFDDYLNLQSWRIQITNGMQPLNCCIQDLNIMKQNEQTIIARVWFDSLDSCMLPKETQCCKWESPCQHRNIYPSLFQHGYHPRTGTRNPTWPWTAPAPSSQQLLPLVQQKIPPIGTAWSPVTREDAKKKIFINIPNPMHKQK